MPGMEGRSGLRNAVQRANLVIGRSYSPNRVSEGREFHVNLGLFHNQKQETPLRTPRYASAKEAAEYVGCSVSTIERWIARGELTAYRYGTRLTRVDLNEIDQLLLEV